MDVKRELFLPALKAALKNETVSWEKELEPQVWMELFQIAGKHQVLPMIYEAVYGCPAARKIEPQILLSAKQQTIRAVMLQTMKTSEFLGMFADNYLDNQRVTIPIRSRPIKLIPQFGSCS